MFRSKGFQLTVWAAVVVFIVAILKEVAFVFHPLVVLITSVAFPIVVAGILFYLTNPVVEFLTRLKIPRTFAILLMFFLSFGLLLGLVLVLIPMLIQQVQSLIDNLPRLLTELDRVVREFQETTAFSRAEQFEFFRRWSRIDFSLVLDNIVDALLQNILFYLGSIANFAIIVFTIPFFLYYMLKDSSRLSKNIAGAFPAAHQEAVKQMFSEVSQTLSSYIQGVLIVSVFVGTFVYIGYRIIGLDYALLLAAVALMTNVIPYFGPIIGTVPGIIVGLIASPWTAVEVLIMILIVQQVESQLIAPQVYGRKLKIHPTTIIIILLTGGNLAGLLGIILAVPTYAAGKVVFKYGVEFLRLAKLQDPSNYGDSQNRP